MNSCIDSKNSFHFSLGRNAMVVGCKILGLKPGDEVLTPAFDCDATLQPFRVLGLKLKFYRIDPYTFEIDLDDIAQQISRRTRLLHIINYFGFPQPWDRIQSFKQVCGIPILEDNAHSLFSSYLKKCLGTFGDVSICSFRKNLPFPDGALLQINNPSLSSPNLKRGAWFYKEGLPHILHYVKGSLGMTSFSPVMKKFLAHIKKDILPPPPLYSETKGGFPVWPLRDKVGREFSVDYERPMSRFSLYLLGKINRDTYLNVIQAKKTAYAFLSDSLKSIPGIRVLHPTLESGTIPFCFSFLVDRKRDDLFELLKYRYDVIVWPTLSGDVLAQLSHFPEVELLGRHLLQLSLPSHKVVKGGFKRQLLNFVRDVQVFFT